VADKWRRYLLVSTGSAVGCVGRNPAVTVLRSAAAARPCALLRLIRDRPSQRRMIARGHSTRGTLSLSCAQFSRTDHARR
jgi:hypothetical protein